MKRLCNISFPLFILIVIIGCTRNNTPFDFLPHLEGNIVTDLGFSQGAAWADYDNDGDEDLFVTNSWTNGDNLFYKNMGNGKFEKIEGVIISNDNGNSNGCTWGDVDNDGDPDLFVANVNNQNNFFYLNNGDESFVKLDSVVAATDSGWSYTCAWADYNNDGWLDLFVGNYNDQANFLYTNDQKGGLIKNNNTVVTQEKKSTQGCTWFDYNNDGWIDLYVANNGTNEFYKNLGNGQFEKLVNIEPAIEKSNSFGCSAADYNNDGFTDLFVATWWGKNNLYKNLGNNHFEKITNSPVTDELFNSEGSSWGDFDNDGDLDLFVTNDGDNSIFENQNGSFVKLTNLCIAKDSSNSNGMTWNDMDNDGDLDIFIANGGNQPNLLYTNPGNKNNWIKIKCVGKNNNRSAIGTKVAVYQKNSVQYREVSSQTGGGYGAQNGLILHFGLGRNKKIDSISVVWPLGQKSKFIKPIRNQILTIEEN